MKKYNSRTRFRQSPHRAGSGNQHMFSEVPNINMQRSVFERSSTHKTTFGSSSNVGSSDSPIWQDDPSMLIPIYVDEVLPGDTHSVDVNGLVRMTTPLTPILDGLNLDFHAFFVPNRILWSQWEKFLGAQDNPNDPLPYDIPSIEWSHGDTSTLKAGTLYDYMGIPPVNNQTNDINDKYTATKINSLPFRAYNMIWHYWFRDENIQKAPDMAWHVDGNNNAGAFVLLPRGKRKDYFTSALPWPQKGDSVAVPSLDADVNIPPGWKLNAGNLEATTTGTGTWQVYTDGIMDDNHDILRAAGAPRGVRIDEISGVQNNEISGKLSGVGTEVNALREAFQIQKFLERCARGGTRINEIIRAHFNVHTGDARIQFPEFLGSGTIGIGIQQVPQTSSTDSISPLGNLAAYSLNGGRFHFHRSFVEHGYIMILASIRQDYTYMQGIERQFLRENRFDFYWPEFAHLGEQAVYTAELQADGYIGDVTRESVFGYQERYAEYRYKPNRASGLMRSYLKDNLAFWHLGQTLGTQLPPVLAPAFIQEAPPVGRILAVPSQPHFLADFYFRVRSARPMPVYSAPGLIDHF